MLSFLCCALQKLCWYVIRDFSDQLKVMHYNLTLKELWVIQNSSSVFGKRMQKRRHKKELLFFFTFSMCVYECVSVEGVDSTPASSLLLFFTKKKRKKERKVVSICCLSQTCQLLLCGFVLHFLWRK